MMTLGEGELTELIHRVQGAHNACTSSELISAESELALPVQNLLTVHGMMSL